MIKFQAHSCACWCDSHPCELWAGGHLQFLARWASLWLRTQQVFCQPREERLCQQDGQIPCNLASDSESSLRCSHSLVPPKERVTQGVDIGEHEEHSRSYLHHLPFSQGNQPPPPNYHMAPALLFRVLNKTDDHPRLVPKGRGFHLGGWNSQHKGPMVDSRLEYAGNMTEKAMPLSCSP